MKTNQLGPGGVSKGFFVGLVSLPIFLPKKLDLCQVKKYILAKLKLVEILFKKNIENLFRMDLACNDTDPCSWEKTSFV